MMSYLKDLANRAAFELAKTENLLVFNGFGFVPLGVYGTWVREDGPRLKIDHVMVQRLKPIPRLTFNGTRYFPCCFIEDSFRTDKNETYTYTVSGDSLIVTGSGPIAGKYIRFPGRQ